MMIKTILSVLPLFVMLSCSITGKKDIKQQPGMCVKLPMAVDGIVRLLKIGVYPEYFEKHMKYATKVGEVSLRTEPGALTMHAASEKENPGRVTILETYASQETYKSHIASKHLQKHKQGMLRMVKTLVLSSQMLLNPISCTNNFIQ